MASVEKLSFPSSYRSQPIAGYVVAPGERKPRAILQITHGMAEYWMRYAPFAGFMAENGYLVCGHDDLGHGETSGAAYPDGYFAPKDGAVHLLNDIHGMTRLVKERYPGLPLILFGHSMGSFFARWACEKWPDAQTAAIYCGTGGANPAAAAGIALTGILSALRGPEYRSKLIDGMAFGAYQKRIPNPRTRFDWLSSDAKNVDDYIGDEKCGFLFTVSAFHEMMTAVRHVNTDKWAAGIRKDMPVLLTAGEEDPVGLYGSGPKEVAARLSAAGVKHVDLKLYPRMRHEILNETDKQTVWNDLLDWCDGVNGLSR